MSESDMRLRLVVRRNGLPEARLMWNIRLESDPTVANLLEQLNNDVPLEAEQWGLEDYVVELHDEEGMSFECLHYQPVREVLKPNDRVIVRALERDDNRRRRVSGRLQISTDGKHLLDGVPFGRRRLKSASRPPIHIPPRKRPRLTYDQDEDSTVPGSPTHDERSSMLLLTNGEAAEEDEQRTSVRFTADFEDADADAGDDDFDSDMQSSTSNSSSEDSGSEEGADNEEEVQNISGEGDLEEELRELKEENDAAAAQTKPRSKKTSRKQTHASSVAHDKISSLHEAFPSAPEELCRTILKGNGDDVKAAYGALAIAFPPQLPESVILSRPKAEGSSRSKRMLGKEVVRAKDPGIQSIDDNKSIEQADQTDSEVEPLDDEITDLIRQYDHRGLPPGSITSGKGLMQMAAISKTFPSNKLNGGSETTSATLNGSKLGIEKTPEDDDDETSSSGTSSSGSSSSSSSESDDEESEDESSDDDELVPSDNQAETSSSDDSDDSDDSDIDENISPPSRTSKDSEDESSEGSEDVDDSALEETTPKQSRLRGRNKVGLGDDATSVSDTSSDSSDDEASESSSSDSNSSDDGSEAESSSESETEDIKMDTTLVPAPEALMKEVGIRVQIPPQEPLQPASQPTLVPPGTGKEATKSRNARRRAAKKRKRLVTDQAAVEDRTAADVGNIRLPSHAALGDESATFEARRNALLQVIDDGGIEINVQDDKGSPDASTSVKSGSKRKREEQDLSAPIQAQAPEAALDETLLAEEKSQLSPVSTEKRRRVDLGAGRRLVFGALGLRNPKSKEDEAKIRDKLMKGVRPHTNPRLQQTDSEIQPPDDDIDEKTTDDDLDSWRDKINYRAVECCHDSVELSEPPFPFVQRWDPQQQGSWFHKQNKRGGQGKRAQRDQAHYYQDKTHIGKKRRYDESVEWIGDGYDETFHGFEDGSASAGVELNYDDIVEIQAETGADPAKMASQATDVDDLPSLPLDISALPILRPEDVRIGMVITWQKWSLSSATNWQPQISNVTGVIVKADDSDDISLEVCLAKRDRHLDGNPKIYDYNTGQRIYDRFEAPDLGEDAEDEDDLEDQGFRTLSFVELQDPRILQRPLDEMEDVVGSSIPIQEPEGSCLQDAVDSTGVGDTDRDLGENSGERKLSQGMPSMMPAVELRKHESALTQIQAEEKSGELTKEIATTIVRETTKVADDAGGSTSLAREQSSLVTKATTSDISDISSPSRQLHETTSQAISATTSQGGSALDSTTGKDESGLAADDSVPEALDMSSLPARDSSMPNFGESDVITGTPKAVHHKAAAPSSASSVRSGRQPDYSIDMDVIEPDSFKVTDDEAYGVSTILGEDQPIEDSEDMPTPTPTPVRPKSSQSRDARKGPSSSLSPSTPGSLSSLNTIWCTARTSHNTQSPVKSQQSILVKESKAANDTQYEEATHKLDNRVIDEDVGTLDSSSRVPDSFKSRSQSQSQTGLDGVLSGADQDYSVPIKISPPPSHPRIASSISPPPPRRRRRSTKPPTPFSLPPGTQVFEVSSDPEEPVFTEDYADDDVDATYSPTDSGSLPRGSGWIQKRNSGIAGRNVRARPVLASSSQPIKNSSSMQSSYFPSKPRGNSVSPTISDFPSSSQGPIVRCRAARKTSARF